MLCSTFHQTIIALVKWIFVNVFIFSDELWGFQGQGYSLDPKVGRQTHYLAYSQHSINISRFHSSENISIAWMQDNVYEHWTMQSLLFNFFPSLSDYLIGINSTVFDLCPLIFLYPCKIYYFIWVCLICTNVIML